MSNSMVTPRRTQNLLTSKIYIGTIGKMVEIQDWVLNTDFRQNFKLLFTDPNQYMIRCMVYSLDVGQYLTINGKRATGDVKFSNVNSNITCDFAIDSLIECGIVAQYTFNEYFNSFLDYEPYTKIQIYLPYYDFVDIDVNTYMNKTLKIGLNVNLANGEGVYYFLVDNNVIETFNCKVGIDIPLSQSNANEIARNNLLNVLNATSNAIGIGANYTYKSGLHSTTKNLKQFTQAQSVQVGIGSVVDFINANQQHFKKSSIPSGFLDMTKPQSVYLIIQRPNIQVPSDYARLNGIPSGKTNYLYDLKGYTEVQEIHLERFSLATNQEMNEIENLLKMGVIL